MAEPSNSILDRNLKHLSRQALIGTFIQCIRYGPTLLTVAICLNLYFSSLLSWHTGGRLPRAVA